MKKQDKYKALKVSLQAKKKRGDVLAIADKVGLSAVYVSNVLNPANDIYNAEIMAEAVRIITDRESSTSRMLKQLGA